MGISTCLTTNKCFNCLTFRVFNHVLYSVAIIIMVRVEVEGRGAVEGDQDCHCRAGYPGSHKQINTAKAKSNELTLHMCIYPVLM